MSKTFKRCITVVMCITFILSLFTGCGKPAGKEAKDLTAGQTAQEKSEVKEVKKEHLKLEWMIPTQQKISVAESMVVKEIMKKFDVEFELTELPPLDQHPEKKKLLIASQDIPDIMSWVTKDEANLYGPQGAFLELTPVLDTKIPNLKKLLDQDPGGKYNAYTTDGKLYRCPDYNTVSLPIFDFGYMKKEFEDTGVTKLDTWDDVYEGLKKLKAKYPNSYPLIARGKEISANNVKSLTLFSFTEGKINPWQQGAPAYDYDKDEFILGITAPGFKEGIEYFAKLYKEKLLDTEYLTTDMNGIKSKLQNKKGFMLMDFVGGLSGIDEVQKLIDNALYPLELPGVQGKRRVLAQNPVKTGDRGTVVSGKLSGDKLDRALEILNYLYSEECYNLLYWHPDVTMEKDGRKLYKDEMYNREPTTIDVYLPWSLIATFQVNYETTTKPGTPYADYKVNVFMNEKNQDRFVPTIVLPFTVDETNKINDLQKVVDDYYNANVDQFVMGKKSMDKWDAFVNELKTKGGDEIVKIYNDVYKKYFKK